MVGTVAEAVRALGELRARDRGDRRLPDRLRPAARATGSGEAEITPKARYRRIRDAARRRRGHARRRDARPRRHARPGDRDPRVQRAAPPPAAPAGARGQLAVPRRPRRGRAVGPRARHARLGAHGRPACAARLRRVAGDERAPRPRDGRSRTTRSSGGRSARIPGWGRSRCARWTRRRAWRTPRRSPRSCTRSPGTRRTRPEVAAPAEELLDEAMVPRGALRRGRLAARRRGGAAAGRRVLTEALALAGPHARELGCEAELEGIHRLVADGGGAGRQRAVQARDGCRGSSTGWCGAPPAKP